MKKRKALAKEVTNKAPASSVYQLYNPANRPLARPTEFIVARLPAGVAAHSARGTPAWYNMLRGIGSDNSKAGRRGHAIVGGSPAVKDSDAAK